MTGRTTFTDEEWDLLRQAPEAAGLIVLTADKGGTFKETFALAKAYAEARKEHGASQLLDEVVAAGPKKGDRAHSPDELREHGLRRLPARHRQRPRDPVGRDRPDHGPGR